MKTCCFLLWYPPCAAGTDSPCRLCLWVSTAVKASYLFLVLMLESPGSEAPYSLWCPLWEHGSETTYVFGFCGLLTVSCNSFT